MSRRKPPWRSSPCMRNGRTTCRGMTPDVLDITWGGQAASTAVTATRGKERLSAARRNAQTFC
ncbi:hypothetical protein BVIET440_10063 [Burkholderia vietnamiensis]|nr:hypothetical protein BVI434_1090030 [Burkholderia vietnamiensis]CAG9196292.1 hypothetical protein BVI1335_1250015 [Burkholderia vietnamiensis]CAG9213502.1 hypothetical protein BVI2075_560065 [Burkholderia vietnamiensis]